MRKLIPILMIISMMLSLVPSYASDQLELQSIQSRQRVAAENNTSADQTLSIDWTEEVEITFTLDINFGLFYLKHHHIPVTMDEEIKDLIWDRVPIINIEDPLGLVIGQFGTEVTANTLACRNSNPSAYKSKLFFFSTDDGSIYGNGYHFQYSNQSGNFWDVGYTFFAPQLGWIASVNSYYDRGQIKFNTTLETLPVTQPHLQMPNSTTNAAGLQQTNLDLVRVNFLYHNSSITDVSAICKIINEANTFYRQRGIFLFIEELTDVNPANQQEANPQGWANPSNCSDGSKPTENLRGDIRDYENSKSGYQDRNYYPEHSDSTLYIFWDDNTNHDGLDWNSRRAEDQLGCSTNYYTNPSTETGSQGVGESWIRVKPSFPSDRLFIRYHSNLLAHEIGHSIGASHQHSETSFRRSTNLSDSCLGDGADDGVVRNNIESGLEGFYHSILRPGMPLNLTGCYGVPHFSNATFDKWWIRGALPGLFYRQIQPRWGVLSYGSSSHGMQLEYWFVQLNNSQIIDASDSASTFWRAGLSMILIDPMNSSLSGWQGSSSRCITFFGTRSDWNTATMTNRDPWLGYSPSRFCDRIGAGNGNARLYWSMPPMGGQVDLQGDSPPDDHQHHQFTSIVNHTTNGTWVIWPAYEVSGMTPSYGPYAWMALSWEQAN